MSRCNVWRMRINLDPTLIRTMVAIVDTGSFARAGAMLNLTQPTVSLQIRRLEQELDEVLFRRKGRQMVLTAQGELLVTYARRLLALNNEAITALKRTAIEGTLRIGAPEDLSQEILPIVLRRFVEDHPKVSLYVRSAPNRQLIAAVDSADLDLALAFSPDEIAGALMLRRYPVKWIAATNFRLPPDAPLPLVLFEDPCMFRNMALHALDKEGMPWRVAYTATSVAGLHAAVKAGLGVTARVVVRRSAALKYLGTPERLPTLPKISAWLCRSAANQAVAAEKLVSFLREELNAE